MIRARYQALSQKNPKLKNTILLVFLFTFIPWIIIPFIVYQNKKVLTILESDYLNLHHPSGATSIKFETFYKPGTALVRVDSEFQTTLPFSEIVNNYDPQLKTLDGLF